MVTCILLLDMIASSENNILRLQYKINLKLPCKIPGIWAKMAKTEILLH